MYYSPVRHSSSEEDSFDLHVLGTPPAFILSQDQTLHENMWQEVPTNAIPASIYTNTRFIFYSLILILNNRSYQNVTFTPKACV